MSVLPEIRAAVGPDVKIMVDGGFSRGTDIVKAVALGADGVGIGRLYCYGLAAAGSAGAVRALEILEHEVQTAMGLMGVTDLDQLGPEHLHMNAEVVGAPSVLSAFPLLE